MTKTKEPSRKLNKMCVVCGKDIKVFLYPDRSYRGGHYFGKISLPTKQKAEEGISSPGKKAEYWECPKCYWN
jgi:hypothetical protein